jgi:Uma2 family endonuclease
VTGSDDHLAALTTLYHLLLQYKKETAQPWYVTAEVMIIAPLPDRPQPWKPMPDVYVVLGAEQRPRSALDTREEPFPHFICEVASPSTVDNDLETKQRLYADLGAQEYIVFDPTSAHLHEPLRAWHRQPDGAWARWYPDPEGFLRSTVLSLWLRAEEKLLRPYYPWNGRLPTLAEFAAERQALLTQNQALGTQNQALGTQNQALTDQLARQQARLDALEEENARLRGRQST